MRSFGIRTSNGRRRRGVAEIDLLLSTATLLVILFLTWGAFRIHQTRHRLIDSAGASAFGKSEGLTALGLPDLEISPVRANLPGYFPVGSASRLPNRVYVARESARVSFYAGQGRDMSASVRGAAAFAGPSWTWSGFPHLGGGDRGAVRGWYGGTIRRAIGDFADPLKLKLAE